MIRCDAPYYGYQKNIADSGTDVVSRWINHIKSKTIFNLLYKFQNHGIVTWIPKKTRMATLFVLSHSKCVVETVNSNEVE